MNLAFTSSDQAVEEARQFRAIAARLFPEAESKLVWECYERFYLPMKNEAQAIERGKRAEG